ncbi:MAG: hypothetical protein II381_13335, partial [Victivallales bacterium]|nr:hypothetical protein [Victivallales bacterium]
MKNLLTAFLLTGACLMAQRANMLGDVEGVDKWPHKVNVKTELSADKNLLKVTLSAKEFQFGWFQHNLPAVENYADYTGVYGRYRSRQFGHILVYVLIPHEKGEEQEYYKQELGELNESGGEWVEFYLPFSAFTPERNARMTGLKPALLSADNRFEFSINSLVDDETVVEFDSLSIVRKEEAAELERRMGRQRNDRLLVREEQLPSEGVHPRL